MQNFERFEDEDTYSFRKGSEKDFKNLWNLFNQMGYKVEKKFFNSGEISGKTFHNRLREFVELNHGEFDSAIIVIMSHGVREKTFVASDGVEIELMDIYRKLNNSGCPSLQNKPKIFILQFCRPVSQTAIMPRTPSTFNMINIEEIVEREVRLRIAEMKPQMLRELQEGRNPDVNSVWKKSSVSSTSFYLTPTGVYLSYHWGKCQMGEMSTIKLFFVKV